MIGGSLATHPSPDRRVAFQNAVLCAAVASGQLMSGLLFGVDPRDSITYLAATASLALVCGLAVYVPTRRAIRVSPLTALRTE